MVSRMVSVEYGRPVLARSQVMDPSRGRKAGQHHPRARGWRRPTNRSHSFVQPTFTSGWRRSGRGNSSREALADQQRAPLMLCLGSRTGRRRSSTKEGLWHNPQICQEQKTTRSVGR